MPITIPTNQIKNLQQIEAVVSGPDGANRLYSVAGQLDLNFTTTPSSPVLVQQTQTFVTLIGPTFTRKQFIRAIATASTLRFGLQNFSRGDIGVTAVDADWDDESGQVELRIEVVANVVGAANTTVSASLLSVGFQVTILAELPSP